MPPSPSTLFTIIAERLFHASPNGVLVYQLAMEGGPEPDDAVKLVMVNATAERSFGPSPDAVYQLPASVLQHVFRTGEAYRKEMDYRPPGQARQIYYDVSAVKMDDFVAVFYVDSTASRQAQRAEQEQAERTQFILDNALTAIVTFDAVRNESGQIVDFTYTTVNHMAEQLSGRQGSELLGQRLLTVFPGTRASGLFDKWVQLIETGEPVHFLEHYQDDNRDAWFETRAVRLGDGLIESYSDVTELKRVQAEQQQQADLIQKIVDNGKVGMTLFGIIRNDDGAIVDFEYVFTNSLNATNIGRPRSEMIGNRLIRLFPFIAGTPYYASLVEAASSDDTKDLLVPYTKDGVTTWYDISFARVGNRVLVTDIDVTELKQAELEQQRQAVFLTQLVDTSMSGIAVYKALRDEQNQIIDFQSVLFNPAAATTMGEFGDELYALTLRQRFTDDTYPGLFEQLVQVVQEGTSFRTEFYYISVDKWLDLLITRLDDGFLLLFNDVSDQHQHRRQLEQANLELQRSNDNLQQFAYVASHDLQEPLRKIRSFGDMLMGQYGPALGTDGTAMIERMQVAAGRMSTLIIDLLAYSRISTHRDPFRLFSLRNLLNDICEDLSLTINESSAEIHIDELPDVLGDAVQIRQLFQNLLSNALKFRQPDQPPVVRITSRYVAASSLPADTMPLPGDSPRFLEITIADNGIGFDDKYRDRIFQVFQRLYPQSKYSGTGVGLAICRKVVENHGGTIHVASRVGEGATFRVYLPG
ncbi:PAS domain-containing sensor histidine kinase [Spirosoma rigui]|uniref:PAS domain-containing sensor histidine kinase n=1 Tax=Spirosoma rigui TaxID=564064 RepID=UPI0009B09355|nr:ATP-binding protein [Spirosoma rigui]